MSNQYSVYILANKRNGTLYVGITSNIVLRVEQHKNKQIKGFTSRYSVDKLVYYESHLMAVDAIKREKLIKKWRRKWKLILIERFNPEWKDLSEKFHFISFD
jgi:putative endonuclease